MKMVGGRRSHSRQNTVPQVDISVLRQTIDLGASGAEQIAKCLQVGTSEVQQLLLYECDIIFECKVCRSLFRGLANLLAHKRVYCTTSHVSTQLQLAATSNESDTIVVQPVGPDDDKEKLETSVKREVNEGDGREEGDPHGSRSDQKLQNNDNYGTEIIDETEVSHIGDSNSDIKSEKPKMYSQNFEDPQNKDKRCEIKSQINEGTLDAKSEDYKFYTKVDESLQKRKAEKSECVVVLQNIESNPSAVYQIVSRNMESAKETMKTNEEGKEDGKEEGREEELEMDYEEEEEERRRSDVVTVIPEEPKGPVHMTLRQRSAEGDVNTPIVMRLSSRPDCDVKLKTCLKCNTQYSSLKTLNFHMTSLHSEKKVFYPCLYCESEFSQLWVATRHVMRTHRKSKDHMDTLRETIRKRAYSKAVDDIGDYNNPRRPMPGDLPAIKKNKKENVSEPTNSDPARPEPPATKSTRSRRLKNKEPEKLASDNIDLHLFTCSSCGKVFGKKESLTRHMTFCVESKPCDTLSNSSKESGSRSKRSNSIDSEISELDGRDFGYGESGRWSKDISNDDLKKINALIDENQLQCLKCKIVYASISNLHRHAVRHLGWQRFKCELCKFTSYNRSECKSHLRKVHSSKVRGLNDLSSFIIDLDPDNTKAEVSLLSRVEPGRRYSGTDLLPEQMQKSQECTSPDADMENTVTSTSPTLTYNISTRRSPRIFDTKPYQRVEQTQTLFTRSGFYPKLKLTAVKRTVVSEEREMEENNEEENNEEDAEDENDESIEESNNMNESDDVLGDKENGENQDNGVAMENKENEVDYDNSDNIGDNVVDKVNAEDGEREIETKAILAENKSSDNTVTARTLRDYSSSSNPLVPDNTSSGLSTDLQTAPVASTASQLEQIQNSVALTTAGDSDEESSHVDSSELDTSGDTDVQKAGDINRDNKSNIPMCSPSSYLQTTHVQSNFTPTSAYPQVAMTSPNLKLPIYEDISDDEMEPSGGETSVSTLCMASSSQPIDTRDSSVMLNHISEHKTTNLETKPLMVSHLPGQFVQGSNKSGLAAMDMSRFGVISYSSYGANSNMQLPKPADMGYVGGQNTGYGLSSVNTTSNSSYLLPNMDMVTGSIPASGISSHGAAGRERLPILRREDTVLGGQAGRVIQDDYNALPQLQHQPLMVADSRNHGNRQSPISSHMHLGSLGMQSSNSRSPLLHMHRNSPLSFSSVDSPVAMETGQQRNNVAMTGDDLLEIIDKSQSNEPLSFDCS